MFLIGRSKRNGSSTLKDLLDVKFNIMQLNLGNEMNQFQQCYFGKSVSTSTNHVGRSGSLQVETQFKQAEMSIQFQQEKFILNNQINRWMVNDFYQTITSSVRHFGMVKFYNGCPFLNGHT